MYFVLRYKNYMYKLNTALELFFFISFVHILAKYIHVVFHAIALILQMEQHYKKVNGDKWGSYATGSNNYIHTRTFVIHEDVNKGI